MSGRRAINTSHVLHWSPPVAIQSSPKKVQQKRTDVNLEEPQQGFHNESDDESNVSEYSIETLHEKIDFLETKQVVPMQVVASPDTRMWEQQKETLARLVLIVKQLNDKWSDELYEHILELVVKFQVPQSNVDTATLKDLACKYEELEEKMQDLQYNGSSPSREQISLILNKVHQEIMNGVESNLRNHITREELQQFERKMEQKIQQSTTEIEIHVEEQKHFVINLVREEVEKNSNPPADEIVQDIDDRLQQASQDILVLAEHSDKVQKNTAAQATKVQKQLDVHTKQIAEVEQSCDNIRNHVERLDMSNLIQNLSQSINDRFKSMYSTIEGTHESTGKEIHEINMDVRTLSTRMTEQESNVSDIVFLVDDCMSKTTEAIKIVDEKVNIQTKEMEGIRKEIETNVNLTNELHVVKNTVSQVLDHISDTHVATQKIGHEVATLRKDEQDIRLKLSALNEYVQMGSSDRYEKQVESFKAELNSVEHRQEQRESNINDLLKAVEDRTLAMRMEGEEFKRNQQVEMDKLREQTKSKSYEETKKSIDALRTSLFETTENVNDRMRQIENETSAHSNKIEKVYENSNKANDTTTVLSSRLERINESFNTLRIDINTANQSVRERFAAADLLRRELEEKLLQKIESKRRDADLKLDCALTTVNECITKANQDMNVLTNEFSRMTTNISEITQNVIQVDRKVDSVKSRIELEKQVVEAQHQEFTKQIEIIRERIHEDTNIRERAEKRLSGEIAAHKSTMQDQIQQIICEVNDRVTEDRLVDELSAQKQFFENKMSDLTAKVEIGHEERVALDMRITNELLKQQQAMESRVEELLVELQEDITAHIDQRMEEVNQRVEMIVNTVNAHSETNNELKYSIKETREDLKNYVDQAKTKINKSHTKDMSSVKQRIDELVDALFAHKTEIGTKLDDQSVEMTNKFNSSEEVLRNEVEKMRCVQANAEKELQGSMIEIRSDVSNSMTKINQHFASAEEKLSNKFENFQQETSIKFDTLEQFNKILVDTEHFVHNGYDQLRRLVGVEDEPPVLQRSPQGNTQRNAGQITQQIQDLISTMSTPVVLVQENNHHQHHQHVVQDNNYRQDRCTIESCKHDEEMDTLQDSKVTYRIIRIIGTRIDQTSRFKKEAIKNEHYDVAQQCTQSIHQLLRLRNEVVHLNKVKAKAVQEERYTDAHKLKKSLDKILQELIYHERKSRGLIQEDSTERRQKQTKTQEEPKKASPSQRSPSNSRRQGSNRK
jgi:hypothetical protein